MILEFLDPVDQGINFVIFMISFLGKDLDLDLDLDQDKRRHLDGEELGRALLLMGKVIF